MGWDYALRESLCYSQLYTSRIVEQLYTRMLSWGYYFA